MDIASLLPALGTLVMLIALQVVLGFDNLLYIALESKKAPVEKQQMVRKLGIGIAIIFRLLLLFILINLIASFEEPFLTVNDNKYITTEMNLESLIILLGGIFVIYTSIKEIWHMISYEPSEKEHKKVSANKAIFMIVFMNLVFSFDSILSAMALTENNWIIAIAIITGGVLMIVAANRVAQFLQKNRMYEVLGL